VLPLCYPKRVEATLLFRKSLKDWSRRAGLNRGPADYEEPSGPTPEAPTSTQRAESRRIAGLGQQGDTRYVLVFRDQPVTWSLRVHAPTLGGESRIVGMGCCRECFQQPFLREKIEELSGSSSPRSPAFTRVSSGPPASRMIGSGLPPTTLPSFFATWARARSTPSTGTRRSAPADGGVCHWIA
jgi:hypothetical protein